MRKLFFLLVSVLLFQGCEKSENPAGSPEPNYEWVTVFHQGYADSIYCRNGVSGYCTKFLELSEPVNYNDTVKIEYEYSYTGNATNHNTLQLIASTNIIGIVVHQVSLFTPLWIPTFTQSCFTYSAYTLNRYIFSVYLNNGEVVRLKNITVSYKRQI